MEYDVAIVGAGPAGCATALHLARAGHAVIVLDRATFPRDKVCGEGLMPHGVDELAGLGLLDALAPLGLPFEGIAYHAGDAVAVGRFPSVARGRAGLGIRRLRLDPALVEACGREAEVRLGVRVGAVRREGGWILDTSAGPVRARTLVGADGLRSNVRRWLGLGGADDASPRYGARAHFRAPPGRDRDVVDVYMGPRFELYLTPTAPGELNVALLCEKEVSRTFGGDLDGGFDRLVADFAPVRPLLDGAERVTGVSLTGPLRQSVTGVVADRALLVGDAAGFVDAITGEGMSLALASARMAAEQLDAGLRADRLSAADLRPYDARRRALARDLTFVTELVLWGIRKPWLARRIVGNLARHPDAFAALLGVSTGQAPARSLFPRALLRMLGG